MPAPSTLGSVLYDRDREPPESEGDWGDLVRSITQGDQLALHALYERAHRPVFTLILRLTSDRQTAEELTLDVFHDVWRRAATYDAEVGTVLAWIMNQARSRAIDRLRFDGRLKRVSPDGQDWRQERAPRDSEQLMAHQEDGHALHGALATLTPVERQAIETAYFSGLTHAEVAEHLGEPLGTVKTRIRSGLVKLRRALGGENQPEAPRDGRDGGEGR